jgi:ketosteroid isomerase-like protein
MSQDNMDTVEPGTHYGHAGVRRAFESLFESFESFEIEVHELLDLDDRVLALSRVKGHGRGSGLEVDNLGAELWSLRDGRAVKVRCSSIAPRRSRRPA